MAEQQRSIDSLNSTGDKYTKSLPRQKSEQLRNKLSDLNEKWREVNLLAEKRQNQVQKAINQTRQYNDEMKGLLKWIKEANDFLKDQEPAAGDPETLEAQLDQSEVIVNSPNSSIGQYINSVRRIDSWVSTRDYVLIVHSALHSKIKDILKKYSQMGNSVVLLFT